jgi:predicted membrane chloride channel (bestrophin family)
MMATLNEVLTGTERVLDTPLPSAYSIAISQISWIYVLVLPFQLYNFLSWITIPASVGKFPSRQEEELY